MWIKDLGDRSRRWISAAAFGTASDGPAMVAVRAPLFTSTAQPYSSCSRVIVWPRRPMSSACKSTSASYGKAI